MLQLETNRKLLKREGPRLCALMMLLPESVLRQMVRDARR